MRKEPKKEHQHSSGNSALSSAAVILMTSLAEARLIKELQAEYGDSNNEEEDAESSDNDKDLPHDSNNKEDSVGTSTLTNEDGKGKQGSSKVPAAKSLDHILYDILDEAKLDCFSTLEEVLPFIEKYGVTSGKRLRVQRSVSDRFKQCQ